MKQKTIYIDWNLYSILKNPIIEPHLILKDFLITNSALLRQVYSPAHLGDLAQTSKEYLFKRDEDLKYISEQTKNTCIVNYWGISDIVIENRDATEFFKTNEQDNSDTLTQLLDNARKLITDQYGMIRDKILREHFKTDPSKICNFSEEQLDELIKMMGIAESLEKFLKQGLELRTSSTDIIGYIDYYYTAYTNLDLIGFFPDAMSEKGGFDNLKNDAFHSAYGSLCNAFITNDNKCYHKSKFLFSYFTSKSKLLRTCKIKDMDTFKIELNELLK